MMSIIFAIGGFNSWEQAKSAFQVWKRKTRRCNSRLNCGLAVYKHFKEDNNELIHYFKETPMKKFIQIYKNNANDNNSNKD